MSLEPAKAFTGGQRLRNILESLNLPIITEDGRSFTVRHFVFYATKSEPFLFDERNALRNEYLERLGFLPIPIPEDFLQRFPDCVALVIESFVTMAKEIRK